MATQCEGELREKYREVADCLLLQGLASDIDLVRDYLLKFTVSEQGRLLGKFMLDYSPKKRRFGLRADPGTSPGLFQRISGLLEPVVSVQSAVPVQVSMDWAGKATPENPLAAGGKKANPASGAAASPASALSGPDEPKPYLRKDTARCRFHAYVDGSYMKGRIGYGAVVIENNAVVVELYGRIEDPEALSARQVGGEIQAVLEVLDWCNRNGIDEIAILYDFENIEKWATGKYRTNTPMTQHYRQCILECGLHIVWNKVDSHTGVYWNDYADELAKRGANSGGNR